MNIIIMSLLDNSNNIWIEAQIWERNWWLSARNRHPFEVIKNDFVGKMLLLDKDTIANKSVIDIGCGPLSLLQRIPAKHAVALDPLWFDDLEKKYEECGVKRIIKCGEDINETDGNYDEAWIYNCLQHVKNPVTIIQNALKIAKIVRIFEWTYIKPYTGHLHELTPELLIGPFQREGWHTLMIANGFLNHNDLNGNYFMGIFSKENITTF
jgi:hypothetical protein